MQKISIDDRQKLLNVLKGKRVLNIRYPHEQKLSPLATLYVLAKNEKNTEFTFISINQYPLQLKQSGQQLHIIVAQLR